VATRDRPPFRADHVGSLLRPAAVLEARLAKTMQRITDGELRAVEDRAVSELVRRQEDVGLAVATDGEIRRSSWHRDFISSLDGISDTAGQITVAFPNAAGAVDFSPPAYAIDGPLGVSRTIFGEDFDYLSGSVRTATAKQTIPSPSMVHFRGGQAALTYPRYLDLDAFWADLTAAYRREIEGLYDRGCRYLQLDDTSLAYLNDPAQREAIAARGGSALHQHEEYINHINAVLKDRPADLAVTIHLCRGNDRSPPAAEGSYEFVAEERFGRLEVDAFFLEFDGERSGGFAPLRFVP
jgi:5-methyltetrahydropteroyltriglutamate--homocysteine methyltransferase